MDDQVMRKGLHRQYVRAATQANTGSSSDLGVEADAVIIRREFIADDAAPEVAAPVSHSAQEDNTSVGIVRYAGVTQEEYDHVPAALKPSLFN